MTNETQRRVLAADADATVLRLIQTTLQRDACAVSAVPDGHEAWRALKQENSYSAAVLSLDLPGFSGLELLKMMKSDAKLRRIPVVVTTAGGDDHHAQAECMAAGAAACLPKPFRKGQLLAVLQLAAVGRKGRE